MNFYAYWKFYYEVVADIDYSHILIVIVRIFSDTYILVEKSENLVIFKCWYFYHNNLLLILISFLLTNFY